MIQSRWQLCLAVLLALPVFGCSSGGQCDTCKADTDCKGGLVCVNFQDPSTGSVVGKRCGSGLGVTTCRVR